MKQSESAGKKPTIRRADEIRNIDDVRMRLMVNSMKIKIEQQRLMTAVTPGATPVETAVMTNIYRFETIMSYATLAITTFRMAKKAVDFFKSFRKS